MKELNLKQQNQDKPGREAMKPFRCLCGSMLARLVPGGVELKCRRCKRQVIVPLEENRAEKW
jgi:phage FluMu protein Com